MKHLILVLCLIAGAASAQIYTWTDESGQVHFSDVPDLAYDTEAVTVEINGYQNVTHSDTDAATPPGRVVMYATSWCPYCRKARNYFRDNGIPFTEYDIEKNARARREYDALGARGVPVILVGKNRMNGFSAAGFEKLYR
ncbi:MAG: glutaredoxin family protein [Gammaproteobacteria bacterium]|nr:glutaredoxin family protein [Gammaproteobacteria bacterium]